MNTKIIYGLGALLLFLGLLWMFLPHAYHNLITHEDETSHYTHILQGLIGVLLGLILMINSNRKLNLYKR